MITYTIGICDIFSHNNEIKVIESHNETNAVFEVACTKRKEIIYIKRKLLDNYKTVGELRKYFIDYWGLAITNPLELGVF